MSNSKVIECFNIDTNQLYYVNRITGEIIPGEIIPQLKIEAIPPILTTNYNSIIQIERKDNIFLVTLSVIDKSQIETVKNIKIFYNDDDKTFRPDELADNYPEPSGIIKAITTNEDFKLYFISRNHPAYKDLIDEELKDDVDTTTNLTFDKVTKFVKECRSGVNSENDFLNDFSKRVMSNYESNIDKYNGATDRLHEIRDMSEKKVSRIPTVIDGLVEYKDVNQISKYDKSTNTDSSITDTFTDEEWRDIIHRLKDNEEFMIRAKENISRNKEKLARITAELENTYKKADGARSQVDGSLSRTPTLVDGARSHVDQKNIWSEDNRKNLQRFLESSRSKSVYNVSTGRVQEPEECDSCGSADMDVDYSEELTDLDRREIEDLFGPADEFTNDTPDVNIPRKSIKKIRFDELPIKDVSDVNIDLIKEKSTTDEEIRLLKKYEQDREARLLELDLQRIERVEKAEQDKKLLNKDNYTYKQLNLEEKKE
jgi:hypothetical protein